ncbi:hypothetical protein HYT18_00970 [Candidatus Microgenomates bacterium]|nr:hypothetical protein [Candidatus Microgenomates bacterium]
MDAAQEKEQVRGSAIKESGITEPTSEEEIHDQAAQNVAHHLTEAGHPTSTEAVKGGKVLTITPEMESLGLKPAGSEISVGDVIRSIGEELGGSTEAMHRAGQGKSSNPLRLVIGRAVNRLKLKKAA